MNSPELLWQLVRRQNSFLVKRGGVQLSAEPGNLANANSLKYSGLACSKAVDVQAGENGGVDLGVKSSKRGNLRRPAKMYKRSSVSKGGSARVAKIVAAHAIGEHYRPDLAKAAVKRCNRLCETATAGTKAPQRRARSSK